MKKSNLINNLGNKFNNLKQSDVEKIVNIFFDKISKSLAENKRIEIRGFGSFKVKFNKARSARNPKTGENIQVNEKKSVHFKMGKLLKQRINQKDD
ncbi:MAG: integration host factor subunit beta [Pelagibacteraceae bacterium]|nr:integration host factor subunit beta [Pelagibacteraceae bacterium]PPR52162.1 MAG: Integration host factor subunit beta [Alphaproteobacteria bacterium MarineAlpha5_Bin10]|tara:strand:+ start:317 stop:604 length:288 start_codon:yes stop_codon:yes gene_type:complete